MGNAIGAQKARQIKARLDRVRQQRLVQDLTYRPSMREFITDPRWLGGVLKEISIPQRALLIGVRGEPLTKAEKAAWLEATQRPYRGGQEFQVVTVISGARGGKDSRFLAPSQIYEAVYGKYKVNPGETVTIACVAQDANAAHILLKLIMSYLNASPVLSRRVKKERRDAVELTNGVEIRVFASTSRAMHGYSIPSAAMDEVARFRFAGAANSDIEVQDSIMRGQATYPRAKLYKASTPSGRDGVLFDDYERAYGKAHPHHLVWQLSSEKMNPKGVNQEFLARMRETMSPQSYARFFDAAFSEDVGVFLPSYLIESATDQGLKLRPPVGKVIMACDPMLGGADEFAVAGVHVNGQQVEQVCSEAFKAPKDRPMDMRATIRAIAALCRRYDVREIYGDRTGGALIVQSFAEEGITYRHPYITRARQEVYVTRSIAYQESAVLFRAGRIRILDDATTIRQLKNLEQHGDKVDHPAGPGYHDDRSNALCLATTMAAERLQHRGFGLMTAVSRSTSGEVHIGPTATIQDGVVTVERPDQPISPARGHRLNGEALPPWERDRDGDGPPMRSTRNAAMGRGAPPAPVRLAEIRAREDANRGGLPHMRNGQPCRCNLPATDHHRIWRDCLYGAGGRIVVEYRQAHPETYQRGTSIEPSPEEQKAARDWYAEQRRQGRL